MLCPEILSRKSVASFAEAWIEILLPYLPGINRSVASFAEAWIEIWYCHTAYSHPLCRFLRGSVDWNSWQPGYTGYHLVASFAEAWIEICVRHCQRSRCPSLPSRKRGLKSLQIRWQNPSAGVASFAEAWIEISPLLLFQQVLDCRFLRGSVDWNKLEYRSCHKYEARFPRVSTNSRNIQYLKYLAFL